MNKKMKFVSIAAAMAMAASMGVSAFAAQSGTNPTDPNLGGATSTENGTEVWAGVAVDNPDMRIKVTVPTLFAFVVNGSVDGTNGALAVTAENGGLLLPNVKVENVTNGTDSQPGTSGASYDLTTTGDAALSFENYSTWYDTAATDYKGLAVKLTGTIKNEAGGTWTHITTAPQTGAAQDVKKYRLSVNGQKFDKVDAEGTHTMTTPIDLTAPINVEDNVNIDPETKLANDPSRTVATFDVEVGGTRGDYKTAENSARVGTITWKVSTSRTVPTA